MQDLSIYFSPVTLDETFENKEQIGGYIDIHNEGSFPELKRGGVALFYVPEYRGSEMHIVHSEKFRDEFYRLFVGMEWQKPIYDLGTILPGERMEDTHFALSQVVFELVRKDIIPVVIGGSQDLTLAMYQGYEKLEQLVNICNVDARLDLGNPDELPTANGYLSHLLLKRPCYLFNHSNIGLQAPLVAREEMELFEKLYFDFCRLGEFNSDFKKAEPHLRNSDILSLDLSSVRYSELVDPQYTLPNGFYADQICQIAKYAGVSDKLTSFGLFNYYPEKSEAKNVSSLVAQIIWYFIDGIANRKGDFPVGSKKDYMRFSVHLDDFKDEVVFYKSNKTERWWMEVPYPVTTDKKYERHHLVPCDQKDYEKAMKNEIPNLWWKTYQKLA